MTKNFFQKTIDKSIVMWYNNNRKEREVFHNDRLCLRRFSE